MITAKLIGAKEVQAVHRFTPVRAKVLQPSCWHEAQYRELQSQRAVQLELELRAIRVLVFERGKGAYHKS